MENEKSTAKKVLSVIVNILIWLFVIFSAAVTVFTFAAQSSEDGVPSIGGKAILTVNSDSMKGVFNKGDIIICEKLLPEEKTALKENDIITYDAGDIDGDNIRDFNTHRIVGIMKTNGRVYYVTKGDNTLGNDKDPVAPENVIAKYTGTRYAGIGKVLAFLQTSKGFLYIIVLPLVLLFIYELIKFIRKFFETKNAGKAELTAEEEERIRKQAIEEYLRSQGGEAAPSVENTVTEEVPSQEPAAEETAPEETVVEEPAAEELPAEQPAAEETPAEEPVAEEKPVEND